MNYRQQYTPKVATALGLSHAWLNQRTAEEFRVLRELSQGRDIDPRDRAIVKPLAAELGINFQNFGI